MSEILNEDNNNKENENEEAVETASPISEENVEVSETSNESPSEPDFTIKSGVDFYCSQEDTATDIPEPSYSPSQQPPQSGAYIPPQPQSGAYIPPQPQYGAYIPSGQAVQRPAEYTFSGGYIPPQQNPYQPSYRPPVSQPAYQPSPYQQPGYTGGNVGGSYNYQNADHAYQNAVKKSGRKSSKVLIAIAIIVAALGVGGIMTVGVMGLVNYSSSSSSSASKDNTTSSDNSSKSNSSSVIETTQTPNGVMTIPQIIKKLKPSVVAVEATDVGSGTGIIMTKDGYILTNAHVVNGATSYQVITSDGTKYTAKLRGLDSISDIAVLKIEGTFTPAEFGKSSDVVEGETVVAMGNPYGLDLANTTTAGIISAVRNNITLGDTTMDLLQTDASINPGNSGGPLINQYGLVIGITSLKIMSNSGTTSEGLGFAIPIDTAKPIVDEIINNGYLSGRPMVGITGQYLTADYAATFNLPAGILVQSTTAGTDAANKLVKFDMITKINGKTFASMDEFNAEKNKYKAGDSITLTVYRNNKEITVKLVLAENKGS